MPVSFHDLRTKSLNALDKSPKGSIDEPLIPLLDLVNSSESHFTTSCCSGRISVFLDNALNDENTHGKGSGRWLFVSHNLVDVDPSHLIDTLLGKHERLEDDDPIPEEQLSLVYFKFEPVVSYSPARQLQLTGKQVLHITSETLEAASQLLRVALQAGFRNSGLVVSSTGRVTIGIRCSPCHLNVPFALATDLDNSIKVRLLVDLPYLSTLLRAANKAMSDNLKKIERLHQAVEEHLKTKPDDWEDAAVRKERMRAEGLARKAALTQDSQPSPDVNEAEYFGLF